jgi:hypothetical protein
MDRSLSFKEIDEYLCEDLPDICASSDVSDCDDNNDDEVRLEQTDYLDTGIEISVRNVVPTLNRKNQDASVSLRPSNMCDRDEELVDDPSPVDLGLPIASNEMVNEHDFIEPVACCSKDTVNNFDEIFNEGILIKENEPPGSDAHNKESNETLEVTGNETGSNNRTEAKETFEKKKTIETIKNKNNETSVANIKKSGKGNSLKKRASEKDRSKNKCEGKKTITKPKVKNAKDCKPGKNEGSTAKKKKDTPDYKWKKKQMTTSIPPYDKSEGKHKK